VCSLCPQYSREKIRGRRGTERGEEGRREGKKRGEEETTPIRFYGCFSHFQEDDSAHG